LAALVRDRPYLLLVLVTFAYALTEMTLNVAMPVYFAEILRLPGWVPGTVFVVNTVMIGGAQGLVVRGMTGRVRSRVMLTAIVFTASSFAVLLLAGALTRGLAVGVVLAAAVVYTLGELMFGPVIGALSAETAPEEFRGRFMAAGQLSWSLAGAVAPAVYTALLVRGALATSAALVPAPPVVGLDQADAVTRLAQAGLRVGALRERFDEAPFGTVLTQNPEQGIVVPPRGTVDLLVSKGVEMTQVPAEVVGRPQAEAAAVLTGRKLTLSPDVVTRNGFFAAGTVLAVTPEPGRQVRAGTPVVLTVASGRVPVPDVQGRSREQAVQALRDAGFSVRVELQYASGRADRVLDQTPVG